MKKIFQFLPLLVLVPVLATATPVLISDQSAYTAGQTPYYTISGAPPGSRIGWISVKNGASTGEGNLSTNSGIYYSNQVVGPDGRWGGYGSTWTGATEGGWTKIAVFDDGASAGTRFAVTGPRRSKPMTLPLSNVVGVTTWQSQFTSGSSLQTGANLVQQLGSANIKVAMTPNAVNPDPSGRDYPGVDFGNAKNLTDLAQSAPFKNLFSMSFKNFDIDAIPFSGAATIPLNLNAHLLANFDPAQVKKEMHDLTYYLMTTYKNTGDTFTLQDWEGDNLLQENAVNGVITPDEVERMREWEQARYDGVEQAREELRTIQGVTVREAVEFNSLDKPRMNLPSMLSDVIPYVKSDLVSYSAYDSLYRTPTAQLSSSISNDMAFIKSFTNEPLMIGEFGESSDPSVNPFASELSQRIPIEAKAFAQAGAQQEYYWQIVDTGVFGDNGYGLINHAGVEQPSYQAVQQLVDPSQTATAPSLSAGNPTHSPQAGNGHSISISGRSPTTYRALSGASAQSLTQPKTFEDLMKASVAGPTATHIGSVSQN